MQQPSQTTSEVIIIWSWGGTWESTEPPQCHPATTSGTVRVEITRFESLILQESAQGDVTSAAQSDAGTEFDLETFPGLLNGSAQVAEDLFAGLGLELNVAPGRKAVESLSDGLQKFPSIKAGDRSQKAIEAKFLAVLTHEVEHQAGFLS
jgi:hypothetical protein